MLESSLAVIGALSIVLGLASRRFRELPLSEPLIALACGALLGPRLVGLLEIPQAQEALVVRTTTELVLAVSLMAVALRYPLAEIRPHVAPVLLLITVVLVGMAGISTALAVPLLGLPLAEAALLGAVLAPTDPVLASSVVTGEPAERDLPERLRILLSIESGANDGLAFALVALGAVAATHLQVGGELRRSAVELAIAVVVGVAAGLATGRLLNYADQHRDIEHSAFLVLTVALAMFVLGTTKALGGQGIIAVFVAGLAYNHEISTAERREEWEVQEAVNQFLVLPAFVLFGVALPWDLWGSRPWTLVGFAVAVLLLRRLPLILPASRPLRLPASESAFLGWFGPIGVAALFYLSELRELGQAPDRLWAAGAAVIAMSTVIHGVTSTPGRLLLARRARSRRAQTPR